MDDRRCPFCGGALLDKICIDCGFEYLTEDEIAAPYDFVPENDAFGEAEPPDDTAEMEDIFVPLAETMPEAVNVMPAANKAIPKKTNYQPHNVNQYNTSPNIPVQNPSVIEMIVKDFVEGLKKHWWKMLITLLFPLGGFLIGVTYCTLGGGGKRSNSSMDLGLILKGIGYIAAAGMLIKLGIGFGIS
ncbi:MAG: hypothetical protein IJZ72_01360 [Oscillospiraceae bacterium]|nr:hypothetical protein [Oscillospiraceae bacterium]